MSKARQHIGLKSRASEPKRYTVTVTEEHIAFIRSLVFRVDLIWIRHDIARMVTEDGKVEPTRVYECYFCNRGSWESAEAIAHDKDCIVVLVEKEFRALNTQFLAVETEQEQHPC